MTPQNKPKTPLAHWFFMRSIKAKLTTIIMLISSIGIVLAGSCLVIYEWFNFRHNMSIDLRAVSAVIADNSQSAVQFNDVTDATKVLESLANKPTIINAYIYRKDHRLLAAYNRLPSVGTEILEPQWLNKKQNCRFTEHLLICKKSIVLDNRTIGTVYLSEDDSELTQMMGQLSLTVLAVLVLVMGFAYFLATLMQNYISRPLISLASLTRQITRQQNYALRAVKQTGDELGDLSDDFNAMLHQVQTRQAALQKSERRFETLLEQAADALYLCERSGKIVHVNQSACHSLGYSKKELYKMNISEIDISFEEVDGPRVHWLQLQQGESKTCYSLYQSKDGSTFPVELNCGLLDLEDSECVLSFARDITQRKRAQAALQKAHDDLESKVTDRTRELSDSNMKLRTAKEKAETASLVKSEFLANMSHEIRTPMNSIMGFTDLLQSSNLNTKQRAYLDSIQSGAKGLMTIINDVLDLSKIEAGKLHLEYEPVDIHELFEDIKRTFSHATQQKGLLFEVDVHLSLPKLLMLDQTRIRQILFNLVGNAIKFTNTGFIRIEVATIPKIIEPITHPKQNTVDLCFTISDSGIGIKPDQIAHIFKQFTQQKGQSTREFGGTGLGLSICTNLCSIMGGHISVISEVDKGSVFTVTLDEIALTNPVEPVEQRANSEFDITFDPAKVLLVDDIPANRLLVKEQFDDCGITFYEAGDGIQAIEMANSLLPDLIIMDMRMPRMNGHEANRQLKLNPHTKDIPVIALTASVTQPKNNGTGVDEFCAFLRKPSSQKDLCTVFKRFLSFQSSRPKLKTVQNLKPQEVEPSLSDTQLNMLLTRLNMQTTALFRVALCSGLMSDIQALAKNLEEVGRDFDSQKIVDYSDRLYKSADLFDIEEIEKQLAAFEPLVCFFESL